MLREDIWYKFEPGEKDKDTGRKDISREVKETCPGEAEIKSIKLSND